MGYKNYKNEIKIEAKRLYVHEGLNAKEISRQPGMPTHATISNWVKICDKEGLDWNDERDQFQAEKLALLAPGGIAVKILQAIQKILSKDLSKFSTKDADAIAKLHKSLERITDKSYHIHMMYEVLQEYVSFLKENYPEVLKDGVLFNSIRNFKNTLLKRLGQKV